MIVARWRGGRALIFPSLYCQASKTGFQRLIGRPLPDPWLAEHHPDDRRRAFGVDTSRRQFYSLRQSRYDALAQDISDWAGIAAGRGQKLTVLDVGCGWGALLCHLAGKPHFDNIIIAATETRPDEIHYKGHHYHAIFPGKLEDGYKEITSSSYDIVVCEQVLEHLPSLGGALATLERLTKPGGLLILGVPIFPPPLHLIRKHIIPKIDPLLRYRKLGSHQQAFSRSTFLRELRSCSALELVKVRGFRIISGGLLRPLENYRFWWSLNRKIGALIPGACIEIQVVMRKIPTVPPATGPAGAGTPRRSAVIGFSSIAS